MRRKDKIALLFTAVLTEIFVKFGHISTQDDFLRKQIDVVQAISPTTGQKSVEGALYNVSSLNSVGNSITDDHGRAVNLIIDSHPYNLLEDFDYRNPEGSSSGLPYFWHIHKSGGTSMRGIFTCLQKIQTRKINRDGTCADTDATLKVCDLPFGETLTNKVINVDASSLQGIKRAIDLRLTDKGAVTGLAVDPNGHEEPFIVATSRFYDALELFSPHNKGKLFILLRHPVERVISKYFYMKKATWESSYRESVASMSLIEYAKSKYCDSNWVTRRLLDKMEGNLTNDDLILAKEILRRKALILLLDDFPQSVQRLRRYFGWHDEVINQEQAFCMDKFIKDEPMNVNKDKESVSPGSAEWNTVRDRNLFDIELMTFAMQLYIEQGYSLNDEQTT